jgi:DNA-binding GntR family transcriptional regulator
MTSCHYLTLDEKIALIKDYADGAELSQRKLCEKYKVSKGVVYNILQ